MMVGVIKRLKEQRSGSIEDQIRDEKLQYDINRDAVKI